MAARVDISRLLPSMKAAAPRKFAQAPVPLGDSLDGLDQPMELDLLPVAESAAVPLPVILPRPSASTATPSSVPAVSKRKRPKANKPATFAKVPVETLLSICSYLRIGDLLRLSRVCVWLRGIILDKQLAGPVWAEAQRNDPLLPPLPADRSLCAS